MHLVTQPSERGSSAQPAHELFGQAASLLATARALEVASRTRDTATAVQPTLACLESSLEALAECAGHLAEEVLRGHVNGGRPATRGEAEQHFAHLVAALTDARVACGPARVAAGTVARGQSPR